MLLSKNSPNRYPEDRIYKTGPNFLNKFSSRLPTDDELRQAQTSLSLLKSKMKFNAKGRGANRRNAPRQVDDLIGDFGGQNVKRGGRNGGKGNYRKVFKPNSQLENINKREQMIMGNIDMLDDNLNMQREILGSHSHNNLPPKRMKRGDKSRGQMNDRGYGRKIVQDFGDDRNAGQYDPSKYRTRGAQGNGMSSTSTAHTRRKENRRAGKTPPRRYNDSFGDNQRADSRGKNQPAYGSYTEKDPFAKGDNRMMGGERDPFAKGDNRMMQGEEKDPFAKGDNRMMGGGNRREDKSSRSRRNNQMKRIKPNKFGDDDYESGGGRKRRQPKQAKKAWDNTVYDPYAEQEATPQSKGGYDDYEEEENTFGNPDNFSNMRAKKSSGGRRKQQSKRRIPEKRQRQKQRSQNEYKRDNQRGGYEDAFNSKPVPDEDRPIDQGGNQDNDQILMEAQMAAQIKLYPCGSCGRKFKKDTLAKHRKVCKKVFKSKRPKFDDVAMRHGNDPEALRNAKNAQREIEKIKKGKKKAKKRRGGFPENNKKKWKKESEAFRAQIKMARGGKISKEDERVMKEAANIGMVQCPHCTRSFGQKAADRHIPICADKAKRSKYKNGASGPKKRNTKNRRRAKY